MKRSHRGRAPAAALVAMLLGSTAYAGPTTITYQYDPLGQLRKTLQDGQLRTAYDFDAAGNRMTSTAYAAPQSCGSGAISGTSGPDILCG